MGEEQEDEIYQKSQIELDTEAAKRIYVVAYDLLGSSGGLYDGPAGAERDRRIQSVISNWFIAFGGKTQRAGFGGGDLGFGYFESATAAIQACLWAAYHLNLLKATNPLFKQKTAHAGFGIVRDEVRCGHRGQVRSDWLSRFAKAWKREAERIADSAARNGRPVVAIHGEMAGIFDGVPVQWLGASSELDGIPVSYIESAALDPLPWQRRAI